MPPPQKKNFTNHKQLAPLLWMIMNSNCWEVESEKRKVFTKSWMSTDSRMSFNFQDFHFYLFFCYKSLQFKLTKWSILVLASYSCCQTHHWKFCVKLTFFFPLNWIKKGTSFSWYFHKPTHFFFLLLLYVFGVFGLAQCLQRIFNSKKIYIFFSFFLVLLPMVNLISTVFWFSSLNRLFSFFSHFAHCHSHSVSIIVNLREKKRRERKGCFSFTSKNI